MSAHAASTLRKTVVIDIVALTQDLITNENTPFLASYLYPSGRFPATTVADIQPAFPAVTCTAQTTYLTGTGPSEHGILGNNTFDREFGERISELAPKRQPRPCPRLFERVKRADPNATTFSSFWWFPMGDRFIDYALTPRPQYLANNGKVADIWTKPEHLRHSLQRELGTFPLHDFWGPTASIASSKWIVDSTICVDKMYDPTFSVIYLPHLDYALQHTSTDHTHPTIAKDLKEIDAEVRRLVHYYEHHPANPRVIILSEYGIQPVTRPVHINRNGGETLDPYASIAFAIPDHQVAHVYVNDQSSFPPKSGNVVGGPAARVSADHARVVSHVQAVLEAVPGVKSVLRGRDSADVDRHYDPTGRWRVSDHDAGSRARVGDLVVVADHDAWFTYYYWERESNAPDFAYTVNIHRKPGYDPVEMYHAYPLLGKIYLLLKVVLVYLLHFRGIIDNTRFDADRIRGSHGATHDLPRRYWPVLGTRSPELVEHALGRKVDTGAGSIVRAEDVAGIIWAHLTRE
ncbi:alkaline-phosphatase-like protein [Catenaria anguillulae PL171]|uniref:Alkaline-phosphatase-like protein n=1 Tax=Catenaria anguillulae PL171 TaxID=765915 RepID=A0A1Y2I4D3_9FUNG|nr:alkaline-phosphatase-like protein [Catenaria anguillulae PL171]